MTLPTQREKQILDRLQQGDTSINELVETLNVSAMTVHRDLNRLAAAGLVVKIHGAASLAARTQIVGPNQCAMCGKHVSERTAFIINFSNGERKRACCAHCGLALQVEFEGKGHALAADFLHEYMVSAEQAFYLINSEAVVCCVPSILTFGSKQEAERFQQGFGGQLMDMQEAIQFLNPDMPPSM